MKYFEDVTLDTRVISRPYLVSKKDITAFARQWDPRPYHISDKAARDYESGLIGSGCHSYAILTKLQTEIELSTEPLAIVAGLGLSEVRFPTPLRPGDTVYAVGYSESKRESKSRPGFGIIHSYSELFNQIGQVIVSCRGSALIRRREV